MYILGTNRKTKKLIQVKIKYERQTRDGRLLCDKEMTKEQWREHYNLANQRFEALQKELGLSLSLFKSFRSTFTVENVSKI